MSPEEILARLVAFPSVVGRPNEYVERGELAACPALIERLAERLSA